MFVIIFVNNFLQEHNENTYTPKLDSLTGYATGKWLK